jgi:hypothetical protein
MLPLDVNQLSPDISIVIDQGSPIKTDFTQRVQELEEYTTALEKGIADLRTLRKLIILCHRNPGPDSTSPPVSPVCSSTGFSNGVPMSPLSPSPGVSPMANNGPVMLGDIWDGGNRFERLFSALCNFLRPDQVRLIHCCRSRST